MTGNRSGPRPLPLLMAVQALTALSSMSALPLLRSGSLNWSPKLQADAAKFAEELQRAAPDDFARAVQAEAVRRMNAFADGVQRYQQSPPTERPPAPPVIWQKGSARLLDYGWPQSGATGPAILCIPSLINRAYILDLTEKRSLMRNLAARGLRPILMDWGTPDEIERGFDLTDYIGGYLGDALHQIAAETGVAVSVLGYCMGGNLALGLAALHPARIRALCLLATPWDFHAGHGAALPFLAVMRPGLEQLIDAVGVLPVDVLQALFNGLNPSLAGNKFRAFAGLTPATAKARAFVALEDWLNDGVPLAGPVARECLFEWYLGNTPGNATWRVGATIVDPAALTQPALVIVPDADYIVPPASAVPLARVLPHAKLRTVNAGHIGMVAGGRAKSILHTPVADWLLEMLT